MALRVPPTAFSVPMIGVCSAMSVMTVLSMRSALRITARIDSMRSSVKTPLMVLILPWLNGW